MSSLLLYSFRMRALVIWPTGGTPTVGVCVCVGKTIHSPESPRPGVCPVNSPLQVSGICHEPSVRGKQILQAFCSVSCLTIIFHGFPFSESALFNTTLRGHPWCPGVFLLLCILPSIPARLSQKSTPFKGTSSRGGRVLLILLVAFEKLYWAIILGVGSDATDRPTDSAVNYLKTVIKNRAPVQLHSRS